VCTPDAARSHRVNEEIRYFKSLGREDRVSGIIAKGIPNGSNNPATADQECFPTALVHHVDREGKETSELAEPLAADPRKTGDGWKNTCLKAIAGITGVGFNAFAKREAKRTFRRRVGLGLFALLLLALGGFYWDYSRLKVSYYAFASDRWGVPEGVTSLAEHQRTGREISYRFESRGYRIRSVYRVNSFNSPMEDADGTSRTDVVYREDGSVDRLLLRDKNNRLVMQKTYSKLAEPNESGQRACTINFLSKSDYVQPFKADAASLSLASGKTTGEASKSNIIVHEVLFNNEGRLEIVLFRNSYGSPASDASGVFGQKHEYNELGLSIRTINLDSKGLPMVDRKGVQQIDQERHSTGAIARQSYLDADNRAVLNPQLAATMEYICDDLGNQTEWRYLNASGAPTLHKDGYYRAVFEYDAHGSEIRRSLFDVDGKPTLHRDGYAGYRAEFDEAAARPGSTTSASTGRRRSSRKDTPRSRSSTIKMASRSAWLSIACYRDRRKPAISSVWCNMLT
jgi:hypothetical protein